MRRFPSPVVCRGTTRLFVVRDHNGQALAYVGGKIVYAMSHEGSGTK
jgi:hypothetical protein